MKQQEKSKDPNRWFMHRNATKAKGEADGPTIASGGALDYRGQSMGPGGRRLKQVDNGMGGLFGDDDDEDGPSMRRRQREMGEDGDLDEQVYDEEFADDDEKMEDNNNDEEEVKELEVRLACCFRTALVDAQGHAGAFETRIHSRKQNP